MARLDRSKRPILDTVQIPQHVFKKKVLKHIYILYIYTVTIYNYSYSAYKLHFNTNETDKISSTVGQWWYFKLLWFVLSFSKFYFTILFILKKMYARSIVLFQLLNWLQMTFSMLHCLYKSTPVLICVYWTYVLEFVFHNYH